MSKPQREKALALHSQTRGHGMKRLILVGVLAALAVTLAVAGATAAGVTPVAIAQVAARRTPFVAASPTFRARSGRSSASSSRKPCSRSCGARSRRTQRSRRSGRTRVPRVGRRTRSTTPSSSSSARTGEDTIWSVLMEFGTAQATHNHGGAAPINHGGAPGPLHNQIAQPNRARRQHHDLGVRLQQELLRQPSLLRGEGCQLDAELLHRELVRRLRRQRHGRGLGHSCRSTRRPTARTTAAASSACATSSACSRTA